ncbi:alpha-L-rhamnosidase [Catalinimonas alkaloidigena]|uniref:Alpha-L-rhamnosidase n=1 Tax=Catalinimonas alkaloidigena TaxID=1075417 RepID=A0A1G9RNJ6_9BACT|nr:family 78 glycoside hydrolase catalytic domain [Catalinimonas alkaloidigena]SDM24774.1 alpha-L-rhamnosidase [Catalinimonas alkaloidigena]
MKQPLRVLLLLVLLPLALRAQEVMFEAERPGWLQKAEQYKPNLQETIHRPLHTVRLVEDAAAFQGWKAVEALPMDSVYERSFKGQSGVVLDFGEHLTGYFSFSLAALRGTSDAPSRFRLTFGEVPSELATPFDPYPGSLSRAWLQDEVITVMHIPDTITLERRMSFRYLKIELLGSSPYFDFRIADLQFRAVTSVGEMPPALAAGTDPLVTQIDSIGLLTLKECMQTVYEDGPKRDRRLWIGDLYLESLANVYSFQNHDLTKRCFYLLAGLCREDGFLYSNAFETPEPHAQRGAPFLFDYSLLYNVSLYDYLQATGDRATAEDLWPVAKRQMDHITTYLNDEGLFDHQTATANRWWLFVDWNDQLDRQASLQGIMILAMKRTYALAQQLGREGEVTQLPGLIKTMTNAARKHLYQKGTGLFVSGPDRQVSYASQAWMILSGVATKAQGKRALRALQTQPNAVRPGAPYLYHYYVEALIACGLTDEARTAVVEYWGGMVKKGADTFWEVYDPTNERLSPYNFFPVNSYCHAWSCTPVYFIRKYPEIFQR